MYPFLFCFDEKIPLVFLKVGKPGSRIIHCEFLRHLHNLSQFLMSFLSACVYLIVKHISTCNSLKSFITMISLNICNNFPKYCHFSKTKIKKNVARERMILSCISSVKSHDADIYAHPIPLIEYKDNCKWEHHSF